MPRSLNSTLSAALDSGQYQPVILGYIHDFTDGDIPITVTKYRLCRGRLEIEFYYEGKISLHSPEIIFTISRGVKVNGVNYTVASAWYMPDTITRTGAIYTATCYPLTRKAGTIGDGASTLTIEDVCTFSNWVYDDAYAPQNIAWYPVEQDGFEIPFRPNEIITLAKSWQIFDILFRKYQIFIEDTDNNTIRLGSLGEIDLATVDHAITIKDIDTEAGLVPYCFAWIDETNTPGLSSTTTDGYHIHNLGYKNSNYDPPDNGKGTAGKPWEVILPWHLKYLTGDVVTFTIPRSGSTPTTRTVVIEVEEVFDPGHTPQIYTIIRPFNVGNSEVGRTLPASTAQYGATARLQTSEFTVILSASDTTVQAALETLDKHEHSMGSHTHDHALLNNLNSASYSHLSATQKTDLTDSGDSSMHYHSADRNRANHTGTQAASTISGFGTAVRDTVLTGLSTATNAVITATDTILAALGKLQAQITGLASVYAPIAKGVTNGNSHDHSEGDGAQIAHTSLSSIGTNTHAKIDTHIASTSNPHGVTASQTGAQPADDDLTAIAGLSPTNDDVLQRKSGAWTNRTMAQLKTDLAITHVATWVIASPAVGGYGGARIPANMTVKRIDAYVQSATSATFNIEERSTIGSAGTNILSSELVADTNGESVTSFNDAALTAGNWLWIDVSAVSGAPAQLVISLTVQVD